MSFIYEVFNDATLAKILKIAQTTIPTVDARFNFIASKLVDKLSDELSPAGQGQQQVSSGTGRAELKIDNLHDLNSLASFLLSEGIKIDNQQIAFSTIPEGTNQSFVNINNIFLDKGLLVKYVQYLQKLIPTLKSKSDNEGTAVELAVNNLITQINNIVKDTGLQSKKPGEAVSIADSTVLDSFGSKIFDPNYYYADNGNYTLTAGDLKSQQTLNAWLQKTPEANVVMNGKTVAYSFPGSNKCDIVRSLYLRAQNKLQLSKTNEEKNNSKYYIDRMKDIGPSFVGPDGKACSLSSSTGQGQSQQEQTSGGAAAAWQGKPGSQEQQTAAIEIANELIQPNALPLSTTDIDFDRIRNFINKYKQIVADSYKEQVFEEESKIVQNINAIGRFAKSTKNFEITQQVSTALNWVSTEQPQDVLAVAYDLFYIVSSAGVIARLCYNQLVSGATKDKSKLNALAQQASTSASVLSDNRNALNNLIANIKNQVKPGPR